MSKKPSLELKTLIAGFCLGVLLLIQFLPVGADTGTKGEKLQGEIEQTDDNDVGIMNKKSLGNMDYGKPSNSYIKGQVKQEDMESTKENPVNGDEHPDAADKDLMIEWDNWRNRFLQAVLSGTTDALNNDQAQNFQFNPQTNIIESKYPMGTNAWFSCKVMRDGQIKDIQIERSSGFAGYDQAVRESVQSLAGSAILKFPSHSRRISVLQAGGVERTAQINKQYFRFGDVEHYRLPGN
jgi:TonB C terminal